MTRAEAQRAVGSLWRHYKGGLYRLIAVGRYERNRNDAMVYRCETNRAIWIRPLKEWDAPVRPDGPLRFTPVKETHRDET